MKLSPSHYIGGDFSIDPALLSPSATTEGWFKLRKPSQLYSTGRFAMLSALRNLVAEGFSILLPDYLCEAQVNILLQNGLDFEFYKLNTQLAPDLEDLRRFAQNRCAVVVINYFGLCDLNQIGKEIMASFSQFRLVADCVQAPLQLPDQELYPFIFTSLRKFLPVPDGSELFCRGSSADTAQSGSEETFAKQFVAKKTEAAIAKDRYLKTSTIDAQAESQFLSLFSEGENMLNAQNRSFDMSDLSRAILKHIDSQAVGAKRRENFQVLATSLADSGIDVRPLESDQVPLCLPLQTDMRDRLKGEFMKSGIFCPVHWPAFRQLPADSTGVRMAKSEIGLVLDQRYGPDDMLRQVQVVKRFADENPGHNITPLLS